jgi:general secretion pathway protein H
VKRGYTLVEVVVVLLLLALATGVVVPSVGRSVDALRGRAAVAGLASFLRAAREQAITKATICEVSLDGERHEVVLRTGARIRATRPVPPMLRITTEPGQPSTIIFYPQGLSSGGRLHIEAPGPARYVISVEALTGRVGIRRVES